MKRTVLVTGGARGIGRQIAIDFGNAGYNVIINYNRSEKEAMSLVAELNAKEIACQAIRADVSNADDVKRMADSVAFGHVDTLVNNAGIAHRIPFFPQQLDGQIPYLSQYGYIPWEFHI